MKNKLMILVGCIFISQTSFAIDRDHYTAIQHESDDKTSIIQVGYGTYYEEIVPYADLILESSFLLGNTQINAYGITPVLGVVETAGVSFKLPILPIYPYAKIGMNILDLVHGNSVPVISVGAELNYFDDLSVWVYVSNHTFTDYIYNNSLSRNTVGVGFGYTW